MKTTKLLFFVILSIIFSASIYADSLPQLDIPPLGTIREPLPYRIISFHKGGGDKRIIKRAAQLGFNGVQFQLEGDNVTRLKEWAETNEKEGYIKLCHSLGMKVTLWVRELSSISTKEIGEISVDNEKLWKTLDERYEWVLGELLPDIDGLVLTVVETQINAADTAIMNKITDIIDAKCRKYNKDFIVRTFTWRPDELEQVMGAVNSLPDDVIIMTKCNPQDWQIRGIHDPMIGKVGNREQIIEFDVAGEYFFLDHVANPMPDRMKHYFDYGIQNNIDGVCVRVNRVGTDIWLNPQEVSLWALGMFAGGMTDSVDDVWKAWATERYGKEAAEGIIKTLKPAAEVVAEIINIGPFSFGDTRYKPAHCGSRVFSNTFQAWIWDESYIPIYEMADKGHPDFIWETKKAKKNAMLLAGECLDNLEKVKCKLDQTDYRILKTKLITNKFQLEILTQMQLATLECRRLHHSQNIDEKFKLAETIKKRFELIRKIYNQPFPEPQYIEFRGKWFAVDHPTRFLVDQWEEWIEKTQSSIDKGLANINK
ncbi:MAG: hypothetical protein SNJ70_03145 [Armatimonadota bacterium]